MGSKGVLDAPLAILPAAYELNILSVL